MTDMTNENEPPKYDAEQIKKLSNIEGIRTRPSMYIGDTTLRGLHHIAFEVVDNSIDEAGAGYGKVVRVRIHADGSVSVSDDGRGIPVGPMPDQGNRPAIEVVLTDTHAGGKFNRSGGYARGTGGLHGVGIKATNALSEWLQVESRREGHAWTMEFSRGIVTQPLQKLGSADKTGTTITFKPDQEIFPDVKFHYDILQKRLQELAFLNPGIRIQISDERTGQQDDFHYEGGLVEFVTWLNRTETTLHSDVIRIKGVGETTAHGTKMPVEVDIALQYNDGSTENVRSFTNNINTIEGGTHLSGFRGAITRSINAYGKKSGVFDAIAPVGDDFREGLTAIVTVNHPDPQFEGQTKTKLGNSEVEGIVASIGNEELSRFFEEHPAVAKRICQKAKLSAEAREAARKARELVIGKKGISGGGLPEKLRDCRTHDLKTSELFLVEGDSAGGSADTGRDSTTQAILPLRGKILNVEKAQMVRVLENEEVANIFRAIGVPPGSELEDAAKRRYGKVILMTDADVDGSHIRTLLLTFMFRHLRPLVEQGCIYIAQPPLYRVTQKKHSRYVQTVEEMTRELVALGLQGSALNAEDGRVIEGEQLQKIASIIVQLEEPLITLEKRGVSLRALEQHHLTEQGLLPRFRVYVGRTQHWFNDKGAVEAFLKEEETKLGRELKVADAHLQDGAAETNGESEAADTVQVTDLHEVRSINLGLTELATLRLGVKDLVPQPPRSGEAVFPFSLTRDQDRFRMATLRDLLDGLRKFGEKGLNVTRFKGLGEMNADELGDTTMDPNKRTLLRVTMEDASSADEIFRVLMGDHVEPRRDFIEKHALDVKELDV